MPFSTKPHNFTTYKEDPIWKYVTTFTVYVVHFVISSEYVGLDGRMVWIFKYQHFLYKKKVTIIWNQKIKYEIDGILWEIQQIV